MVKSTEELLPLAHPIRFDRVLDKGHRHAACILDSQIGPLVARVTLHNRGRAALSRLHEHQRVWEQGAPVPKLYGYSPLPTDADRILIVTEYLEGQDAEDAQHSIAPGAMTAAIHAAGAAVAKLHRISAPLFGEPYQTISNSTNSTASPTWADAVRNHAENLCRAYHDMELPCATLIQVGIRLLRQLADDLPVQVRPSPTHLDVYLPNILLDPSHRFRALLDLEHIQWTDPVRDFVKPAMWIFEAHPFLLEPFTAGYRSVLPWPSNWDVRMSTATGWELLTGVRYWTRTGNSAMRDDYIRRLRHWVDTEGGGQTWPNATP